MICEEEGKIRRLPASIETSDIVGDVVSSGRENGQKSRKPRISETIIIE